MTKILLTRNSKGITCNAKGHASFARKGKDIVCAAVSILFRTAIQVLQETNGITITSNVLNRGALDFCALIKDKIEIAHNVEDSIALKTAECRLECVCDFLKDGFLSLAKEFPNNVFFEYKNDN